MKHRYARSAQRIERRRSTGTSGPSKDDAELLSSEARRRATTRSSGGTVPRGKHDHVEEIAGGDDADPAAEILRRSPRKPSPGGVGETRSAGRSRRGRGTSRPGGGGCRDQVVARPPHADVHPVT